MFLCCLLFLLSSRGIYLYNTGTSMTCLANLRSENTRLEQHSSAAAAAAAAESAQLSGKEEENKQLKSEISRLMTDLQNLTQVVASNIHTYIYLYIYIYNTSKQVVRSHQAQTFDAVK